MLRLTNPNLSRNLLLGTDGASMIRKLKWKSGIRALHMKE
jgi:hypothetical protein